MKITVVGHWGAYPEKNEATSCYLLQDSQTNILLDCGSGALALLQNYLDLSRLDAVILTHYHHDHMADIGPLIYSRIVDMNLQKTAEPLHIYAHNKDEQAFGRLGKEGYAIAEPYHANETLTIGSFKFSFQETSHTAPCYAVKVENEEGKSIVYTGDTRYDEALIPFIKKANLFITEASFYEHQDAASFGHMNSKEAALLAEKGQVDQLLLSHLPHFGDHKQLLAEGKQYFSKEIILARKGLVLK